MLAANPPCLVAGEPSSPRDRVSIALPNW